MTDYIDRQAAIDAIERLILPQTKGETAAEEINRIAWRCAINCAEEVIGHLPSAEVEPIRHGEWIWDEAYEMFTCSECGKQMIRNDYPYCAFCGALMDKGET